MRGAFTTAVSVLAALALGGAPAVAAEPAAPGPDTVHVMDNSEYYHRADCPRLHFATAVTLAEAATRHRPCPVCHPPVVGDVPAASPVPLPAPLPDATTATPLPVAPAPAAATTAATPAATQQGKPRRPGKYRWLGLGIGAGLGFLLGAAIDFDQCFLQSCSGSKEGALVLGFTAAGGFVGYVAGGGFSHRSDEALERGREAIRQASAAGSRPAACTLAATTRSAREKTVRETGQPSSSPHGGGSLASLPVPPHPHAASDLGRRPRE